MNRLRTLLAAGLLVATVALSGCIFPFMQRDGHDSSSPSGSSPTLESPAPALTTPQPSDPGAGKPSPSIEIPPPMQ